jgi:hypothetical protein
MLSDAPPDGSTGRWTRDLAIGSALYAVALLAILIQIGARPAFAYNWENYTLWQGFPWWAAPGLDAFDLTDGLMTDSGRSWWVLGPVWVAFRLADPALEPLRIATGVVAAFSAPLTWILARRLIRGLVAQPGWNDGERATLPRAVEWAAIIAGLLLPAMASWLLYARTGTLVGLSVAPALLTILTLDQTRRLGRHWWMWLIALQAMLVLGAWAYAPIRFLYPLALALFGIELLFQRDRWRHWLIAIGVTVVTLPVLLATIDQDPVWDPVQAISTYYNARGEQVFALRENPNDYSYYLRDADPEQSSGDLERALIEQNARDLVRLFFDIDTRPALTDYWNQAGRLMPWFMTPLVLIGLLASLARIFRAPESRLLHLMFWGFTLPMILTSKVHIGRLVFAMPFLAIFAGLGVAGMAWGLTHHLDRRSRRRPLLNLVAPLLGLALIVPVALSSLADYRVDVAIPWEARLATLLQTERDALATGIVWVGGDRSQLTVEEISLAAVRIQVDADYQFVNLGAGETANLHDARPPVYFGAVTELLENPATAAPLCELPWATRSSGNALAAITPACVSADITPID